MKNAFADAVKQRTIDGPFRQIRIDALRLRQRRRVGRGRRHDHARDAIGNRSRRVGCAGIDIRERGDRHFVVRIDQVRRRIAGDGAAMRKPPLAADRSDLHAETVAGGVTGIEQHVGLQELVRSRLQQRLIDDRDVPQRQVVGGHRQLAGAEQPSRRLLRRRRNGPSPLRNSGCASFGPSGPRSKSADRRHLQRREDALLQELHERHAGHALDDRRRDHVVGVAVLPLGARREIERLARPPLP